MTIHESMIAIMRDVPAIGKDSRNQQQGFAFRGIDAVYNELHSLMAKHGVYTTSRVLSEHHEERKTARGGALIYRIYQIEYTFWAQDGTNVQSVVCGEGMDSGDKASNKAFAIAHKYALLQAYMVPTADMVDPDAETHEVQMRPETVEDIIAKMTTAKSMSELTKAAARAKGLPEDMLELVREQYNTLSTIIKGGSNGR